MEYFEYADIKKYKFKEIPRKDEQNNPGDIPEEFYSVPRIHPVGVGIKKEKNQKRETVYDIKDGKIVKIHLRIPQYTENGIKKVQEFPRFKGMYSPAFKKHVLTAYLNYKNQTGYDELRTNLALSDSGSRSTLQLIASFMKDLGYVPDYSKLEKLWITNIKRKDTPYTLIIACDNNEYNIVGFFEYTDSKVDINRFINTLGENTLVTHICIDFSLPLYQELKLAFPNVTFLLDLTQILTALEKLERALPKICKSDIKSLKDQYSFILTLNKENWIKQRQQFTKFLPDAIKMVERLSHKYPDSRSHLQEFKNMIEIMYNLPVDVAYGQLYAENKTFHPPISLKAQLLAEAIAGSGYSLKRYALALCYHGHELGNNPLNYDLDNSFNSFSVWRAYEETNLSTRYHALVNKFNVSTVSEKRVTKYCLKFYHQNDIRNASNEDVDTLFSINTCPIISLFIEEININLETRIVTYKRINDVGDVEKRKRIPLSTVNEKAKPADEQLLTKIKNNLDTIFADRHFLFIFGAASFCTIERFCNDGTSTQKTLIIGAPEWHKGLEKEVPELQCILKNLFKNPDEFYGFNGSYDRKGKDTAP